MKLELKFTPFREYLRVSARGIREEKAILEMARQTIEECVQHRLSKALVDIRELEGGLSTFEAHALAAYNLPNLSQPDRGVQAALLDLPENRIRFEFFQEVATNRGLELRFFTDEASALGWLADD